MQKSLVKSKINNLNKSEIKQAWYSTYGDSYEEGLRFLLKSVDSNSFIPENLLEDIKNKKPIQYILGEWDFYTGTYKISPAVLIPRPETEVLVDYIKNNIVDIKSILDLGTGSGCIAIELAKIFKDAHVLGVDISTKALEIAHKNNWQSNYKVKFMESNWFESVENKFDLIVANPPYVPEKESKNSFLAHEPKIALFSEQNGLADPLKIISGAKKHLNPNGHFFIEHGEGQSEIIQEAMHKEKFSSVTVIKDLVERERFVYGNA